MEERHSKGSEDIAKERQLTSGLCHAATVPRTALSLSFGPSVLIVATHRRLTDAFIPIISWTETDSTAVKFAVIANLKLMDIAPLFIRMW